MRTRDDDRAELERVRRLMERPNAVFVFGSNRRGVHGRGAALHASKFYGAQQNHGEGFTGRAYAIPTKISWRSGPLPLTEIAWHVRRFIVVADCLPSTVFAVTRVGCGLAGYGDVDVAPLFAGAPSNCDLPAGWRDLASAIARANEGGA